MRRVILAAVAAATMLGGSILPAGAQENSPAKTVAMFYGWYVNHHGRVGRIFSEVRELFDDDLFRNLDAEYFKGGPITVCPGSTGQCGNNVVEYDPFANSVLPGASFAVGATHIEGSQAAVGVTLRLADKERSERRITVILHNNGRWYVISNLLYGESLYFYDHRISDLIKFLADYSC